MGTGTAALPRILVTGFLPFPGAPLNPTQLLIAELEKRRAELASLGHISFAVIDVDYQALPSSLAELGRSSTADIAIHFGLSDQVTGFAIERTARNVFGRKPDNRGYVPVVDHIVAGAPHAASRLPVERIAAALAGAGLPVALSDDAGDYLCNYLFFMSCGGHCPEFVPGMSGFVHVPPLWQPGDGPVAGSMTLDDLVTGAMIILRTTAAAWRARSAA